jgi:hypothetical protein
VLLKKKSALPPPLWSFCVTWFHVSELIVHDARTQRESSVTVVLDFTDSLAFGDDAADPAAVYVRRRASEDTCEFDTPVTITVDFADVAKRAAFVAAVQACRLAATNVAVNVVHEAASASSGGAQSSSGTLTYPRAPLWSTVNATSPVLRSRLHAPSPLWRREDNASCSTAAAAEAEYADLAFLLQNRTSVMLLLYHVAICAPNPSLAAGLANDLVSYFTSLPRVQPPSGGGGLLAGSMCDRLAEAAMQIGSAASGVLPDGTQNFKADAPLSWEVLKAVVSVDVKCVLVTYGESAVQGQRMLFACPIHLPTPSAAAMAQPSEGSSVALGDTHLRCTTISGILRLAMRYLAVPGSAVTFTARLVVESAQRCKAAEVQIHSDAFATVKNWIGTLLAGSAANTIVPSPPASSSSVFCESAFSLRHLVSRLIRSDEEFLSKTGQGVLLPSLLDVSLASHPLRSVHALHSVAAVDMLSTLLQGQHAVSFVETLARRLTTELGRKGSVFVQRHEATQTIRTSSDEEQLLTKYLNARAKLELLQQIGGPTADPPAAAAASADRMLSTCVGEVVVPLSKYAEDSRRMLQLEARNAELTKLLQASTDTVAALTKENMVVREENRQLRVQGDERRFVKTEALLLMKQSHILADDESVRREGIALDADRERFHLLAQLMMAPLQEPNGKKRSKRKIYVFFGCRPQLFRVVGWQKTESPRKKKNPEDIATTKEHTVKAIFFSLTRSKG